MQPLKAQKSICRKLDGFDDILCCNIKRSLNQILQASDNMNFVI